MAFIVVFPGRSRRSGGAGRPRRKKTAGAAGGLSGVSLALLFLQLRAIASPATEWGENQKYAKKNREARITMVNVARRCGH
ncbi:MAG TPA: hypothetical protein VFY73_23005, partial [Ideonella sp.]|uniref:hypothetical protein n=1 Tax=Ideonella sp. TaxID=1929293 RepID=UPI002E31F6E3